ncbi:radical SAM protein [Desulfobacula sp.]|uniref:radical SAM protein n=1 Tax=Desulfobacula sp. TaxID=2593537 RepID=UPI001EC6E3C4|nr:hypothetical protein [Desulfobacula sp.]
MNYLEKLKAKISLPQELPLLPKVENSKNKPTIATALTAKSTLGTLDSTRGTHFLPFDIPEKTFQQQHDDLWLQAEKLADFIDDSKSDVHWKVRTARVPELQAMVKKLDGLEILMKTKTKDKTMNIIYEPKGPAKEYAKLAANIYKSCTHSCRYCYAATHMRKTKETFHSANLVKKDAISDLKKDAAKLRGDDREILFYFLGDPYNPDEPELGITRQAIEIMIENDLRFTILTKGGSRVRRDLDLFQGYRKSSIWQTIVFSKQESADYWEPNAAPLRERFNLAKDAHDMGIRTWISLEPGIDPDQALEVVRQLHPYVDMWKVGPVTKQQTDVDWKQFKIDIEKLFKEVGANYILKQELLVRAA